MNKPVSFDLAKLLKEKGFDKKVRSMFCESKLLFDTNSKGNYNDITWVRTWRSSPFDDVISAPTISDVVMWLYEKNGIWVLVDWSQTKWCFSIIDIKEETVKKVSGEKWKERSSGVYLKTLLDFNSPTEAYEAAIEYCLTKLI